MGRPAVVIENLEIPETEVFSSEWVLITTNTEILANEDVIRAVTLWPDDGAGAREEVIWTDDYSNLLMVLH